MTNSDISCSDIGTRSSSDCSMVSNLFQKHESSGKKNGCFFLYSQVSSVGDCSTGSSNDDTECLLGQDRTNHLHLSARIKDQLKRRSSFLVSGSSDPCSNLNCTHWSWLPSTRNAVARIDDMQRIAIPAVHARNIPSSRSVRHRWRSIFLSIICQTDFHLWLYACGSVKDWITEVDRAFRCKRWSRWQKLWRLTQCVNAYVSSTLVKLTRVIILRCK